MQTHSTARPNTRNTVPAAFGHNGPASESSLWDAMEFEDIGVEAEYSRGVVLFSEGQQANHIFLVTSGRVKLFATSREGKTMILRIATSGELLGLSAGLSNGTYELTAETLEHCEIRGMRVKDLLLYVEEHPEAGLFMAKCLSDDYRNALKGACRFSLPSSAAGRLAGFLLDWLPRSQSGLTERRLTMPLTHEEIASMTATTRETVSRTLQQFQRDKLISVKGSSLVVHRPDALRQLSAYAM